MNEAHATTRGAGSPKAIRAIVLTNFILVAICVVPATRNIMEQVFRALEPYPFLPWFFDFWIVASTLVATGLFLRGTLKKSTSTASAGTRKPLVSDGQLLFSWWMTLLAICFYAFMLGRSGF